ncbi:MmcQ/YjbR family DNA-binding protein [Mycobacterium sp. URHB0044]|uniref:MmcQ/YjbR family DNA-binding protein n=1 Tax=Mycobacterium sp. URHB0044 TaxID=1380386 RepID=UPI00048BE8C2|nr:MmcQ/YjbR family DNA-binding protein [Mycobacterium sp. URHB0044]
MDGHALIQTVTDTAMGMPSATRTFPFGPNYEVFKVVDKVFAMLTEVRGNDVVTLKCEPPYAQALARDYVEITPGYHMNKRHWISICPGERITADLVEDLIVNAYHLVVAGLPRKRRPAPPVADDH